MRLLQSGSLLKVNVDNVGALLKVRVGGRSYLCKWDPNKVVIGGRKYRTVKIGNQIWMAENLDYKFDVNVSQIPIGQSGTPSTPSAWYYDNNEASYGIDGTYKCGLLYNWHAAKYLDDNKATLLPSGWHVPSNTEWTNLRNTIGNNPGTKLKALNNSITSNWPSGWGGIDDYGFTALPSGYYDGSFSNLGSYSLFWTSTELDSSYAYFRSLGKGTSLDSNSNGKIFGYSLRLVKDAT